ncbi:hypothetical protein GZ78_16045 [Endozoicomonas numazuensis]|uniref:Uncharacterized protein n=1 Tax=Endozoicomonas numazuensis TaxID=1137799 RepID=A0A081NFU9_9GAMM|nr:hypothetical protein GZ78_16045 [Endozoicomonas numazuensis]
MKALFPAKLIIKADFIRFAASLVGLRNSPKITSLFKSAQNPFGLSLSKPNAITLRQAQGERSPGENREVILGQILSQ